jgi:GNAT superfamily N-acetyltransferase
MRFIYYAEAWSAGFRELFMYDEEGLDRGRLVWRVCDACQRAVIAKISLDVDVHRQGYGRRLILRALRDCPGYSWTTSGQSPDGTRFFAAMSAETGAAFTGGAQTCEHIKSHGPPTAVGRRPVLDRSV